MRQIQRKVRVCCFCEQWESGGIESFLNNILHHLDLNRVQVDIVTSSLRPSVFTENLEKIGVRFFELSGNQKKLIQNHQIFQKLIQKEQYDVLHLNVFHGLSLYYVKLAKQAGIPIRIVHSHNTDLRKSLTRFIKLLIHKVSKNLYSCFATDLWACSEPAAKFEFSKKALKSIGFQFIPNGIETRRFYFNVEIRKSVRKELGINDEFVIGNIGRLCYQKNQGFLLDVFSEIKRLKPESYLLIVGEGKDFESLKEKSKQLEIDKSIIFYGSSSHTEELLWAMDVFVFPSLFEGFGIVALEAQATGLPVICSEYVPNEACVTPLFQRLTLAMGAKVWARKILNQVDAEVERQEYAEKIRKAGFDISDVAMQIETCYMRAYFYGAT